MEFLILLLVVLVVHHQGALPVLQQDQWLLRWREFVVGQSWLSDANARLFAGVFAPVFALMLVIWLIAGWFWGLAGVALSAVVLFYAFGRGKVDDQLAGLHSDLKRGDVQAAFHDAEELSGAHRAGRAANWDEFHIETLDTASYRYFQHYFPVIFWFVVLGPPGAALYRLAYLYCDYASGEEREKAVKLLWLLEWLPVRLLGLILALVGDFSGVMARVKESFSHGLSSEHWVATFVRSALGFSEEDQLKGGVAAAADEIGAIPALYGRALVMMMAMVALLTIFR
jgi:AmpE protein